MNNRLQTLLILGVIFLYSCQCNIEKTKTEILKTEHDFEQMVARKGVAEAFSFYVSDSGVINAGDKLFHGKEAVRKHYESWKYKDVKLTWSPDYVDVANSGDLGYTYGKYTFSFRDSTGKENVSHGVFHTVWKRQPDGSWKFVWD